MKNKLITVYLKDGTSKAGRCIEINKINIVLDQSWRYQSKITVIKKEDIERIDE